MKFLIAMLFPVFMFASCGDLSSSSDNDDRAEDNNEPETRTFETPMELLRVIPQFSILVELIERHNLEEELNLDEEITVLAPTNLAFENLSEEALDFLLGNESLARVVVENSVIDANLTEETIAEMEEVLNRAGVSMEVENNGDRVSVGGATIILPNLTFSGGLIHGLDRLFDRI